MDERQAAVMLVAPAAGVGCSTGKVARVAGLAAGLAEAAVAARYAAGFIEFRVLVPEVAVAAALVHRGVRQKRCSSTLLTLILFLEEPCSFRLRNQVIYKS